MLPIVLSRPKLTKNRVKTFPVEHHVMESVSQVRLLMEFTPVEFVKVTWQFGFGYAILTFIAH